MSEFQPINQPGGYGMTLRMDNPFTLNGEVIDPAHALLTAWTLHETEDFTYEVTLSLDPEDIDWLVAALLKAQAHQDTIRPHL